MSRESKKTHQSRPLRADAARNREAILDVADGLLATQGAALSTAEVARQAGVGAGTVFRHFATKEALLRAVVERRLERMTAQVDALALDDRGEALFGFFEQFVEQSVQKRSLMQALTALGVDVPTMFREAGAPLRAAIAALLARAQAQGVVRGDIEVGDIFDLLLAIAHAARHAGWQPGARRQALTVIFDGLRARPG